MRSHSVFTLLVAALLLAVGRLQASTEIPFEFRDGMVWVKVSSRGTAEPLNFLLDSGASVSVLDLKTARRVGTKLGASQTVQGVHRRDTAYHIPEFAAEIAGTAIPTRLVAFDLSFVSAVCRQRVEGLLGADFFRGRIVQIDYAARKVRLLSRAEFNPSGHDAVPLATRNGALCIRVAVGGQPAAWTRVDTGCNSALRWVVSSAAMAKYEVNSIGVAPGDASCICTGVQVGSTHFPKVRVTRHSKPIFSGEAGLWDPLESTCRHASLSIL